jgi:hypothetical protein
MKAGVTELAACRTGLHISTSSDSEPKWGTLTWSSHPDGSVGIIPAAVSPRLFSSRLRLGSHRSHSSVESE